MSGLTPDGDTRLQAAHYGVVRLLWEHSRPFGFALSGGGYAHCATPRDLPRSGHLPSPAMPRSMTPAASPRPCHDGPVLVAFHLRGRCRPLHHVLTRLHPFTWRLRPGSRSVYTSPAASRRRAQHSIPSGWLALRRVGIAPTGKCQLFVAYLPDYLVIVRRGRNLAPGSQNHR